MPIFGASQNADVWLGVQTAGDFRGGIVALIR